MVIIILGIVVLAIFLLWLGNKGGEQVNQYFINAVATWLKYNDEKARLAALAAAKVASKSTRKTYLSKLALLGLEIRAAKGSKKENIKTGQKISALYKDISEKEWTLEDAKKAREELFEVDQEYAIALNKFDPGVFTIRHKE